jgi:hypothetical protein
LVDVLPCSSEPTNGAFIFTTADICHNDLWYVWLQALTLKLPFALSSIDTTCLCKTSCSMAPGPAVKLEHVSEKFAGLWTDLEQEKQVRPRHSESQQPLLTMPSWYSTIFACGVCFSAQNRRVQETTRMQLIQESIVRLEKSLEVCSGSGRSLCLQGLLARLWVVPARVLQSCHFPAMSCQSLAQVKGCGWCLLCTAGRSKEKSRV